MNNFDPTFLNLLQDNNQVILDDNSNNKFVKVVSCTFLDLINTNIKAINKTDIKGQLEIPEYQRPYIWKEKQINRLLNDIIEYEESDKNNKPLFYLGSIILHQNGDRLKIIDGQQRITTLLIMKLLKSRSLKSGIKYTSSVSIKNIMANYSYLKSIDEDDIFEYANTNVLSKIDFNKINVTLVITNSEDLSYTFFETQNTDGIPLDGSDIIKAHHLRAIPSKKKSNFQARKWENNKSERVENIIQNLTKIRFWNNRRWRCFPFYRDKSGIKNILIEEFTERTKHINKDISFYHSIVEVINGNSMHMYESQYKQLRQPLYDGDNTLNYINDYVYLHDILFNRDKRDARISDDFYEFTEKLMHGNTGTTFLKELLEVCIVCYVGRFGYYQLLETSLWLYRVIYSLRVSSSRNVREDSIFKFVYNNQLLDNILYAYTSDELIRYLKRFKYSFNTNYLDSGQSKDRHIITLQSYFIGIEDSIYYKEENSAKMFDKMLASAINSKIEDKK